MSSVMPCRVVALDGNGGEGGEWVLPRDWVGRHTVAVWEYHLEATGGKVRRFV